MAFDLDGIRLRYRESAAAQTKRREAGRKAAATQAKRRPKRAARPAKPREPTMVERAQDLIRRELAGGARSGDEVNAVAEREGIGVSTLYKAKGRIGVEIKRASGTGTKGGVRVWSLPD